MVSKSQSPARRATRQSSRSPSRRMPSKSPASTAKRAASKSPSRKQTRPASKSPARAQPKPTPQPQRSSKSPTRSSTRVKAQKSPEKPAAAPAKAEVLSPKYYPSEYAKQEEYRPSRTMFPDEPKVRREYITPLGVADADEQRGAIQRRTVQPSAAAPPAMDEARKKRKLITKARVNAFIDGVKANVSKFRYLYGFLVLLLLMFCGVYYTGYKVNQGLKKIQAQLNQYVSHVATSYFQKEEPKNRSD